MKNNENKNQYIYDGHSNPSFIWRSKKYPSYLSFEEKVQLWKKEAQEKNKSVQAKEHTKSDTKSKKEESNNRRKIAAKKKNKIMEN